MWRKLSLAVLVAAALAPLAGLQRAEALTISPLVIEHAVKPGQTVIGTVKLRNEDVTTQTFYPFARDFVAGETDGAPMFVEDATRSMIDWVSFDKTGYELSGGDSDLAVYRINVPSNASPGGYFAGLLFSTQRPNAGGVGAVAATGPLVLLRVEGDVVERASLRSFTVDPESATSLPVDFRIDLENEGTVHLKPRGVIRITNLFGGTSAVIPVNAAGGSVLPGSERGYDARWVKAELPENASELAKEWRNFAFGPYTATLVLSYGEANQTMTATADFWVMPWMLIVLFIILLVVLALLVMQYNKWIVARAMQMRR